VAYDKIIPVTTRLDHCMNYVLSREKSDLSQVLDYIGREEKNGGALHTGINCAVDHAYEEMQSTKSRWGKTGGVLGYHLIHSYAPGEVTPQQAHTIGVEFAQRLLGDRYEAVVSTHIDRDHLHCHILFNSVSFADGKKYQNTFRDYFGDIRGVSNAVSQAHGLSVIEPEGKGTAYNQWEAEKTGKPTIRSTVRRDIDAAIAGAFTCRHFWSALERMGYTVKWGENVKHTAICPPGGSRFIRLSSLGEGYSEEEIRQRLAGQRTAAPAAFSQGKRYKLKQRGTYKKATGFQALYLYYLYVLGVRKPGRTRKALPMETRKDVTRLHRYQRQFQLLWEYRIEDREQLTWLEDGLQGEIDRLVQERKSLYPRRQELGTEIEAINQHLRQLRRKLYLCRQIIADVQQIKDQLQEIRELEEQQKTKEMISHGCKRRGR